MTRRGLRSIMVEGYTSIRSARVELRDLNVLIGANGAGKSNFISALALLGRIVDAELNLFVGRAGGASALLHGGSKGDARISLGLDFSPSAYEATLIPAARDELIFSDERIRFHGRGPDATGRLLSRARASRNPAAGGDRPVRLGLRRRARGRHAARLPGVPLSRHRP
ncbi:AAA family ATPase [Nonomuraea sp. ATR24]|uniref:AAA family ATPase n=1 Tax=Nonomuraea sp. ATR24 TaxID=1676744 RepID=UPI0035BF764D